MKASQQEIKETEYTWRQIKVFCTEWAFSCCILKCCLALLMYYTRARTKPFNKMLMRYDQLLSVIAKEYKYRDKNHVPQWI
jgi:hypothetical protein